MHEFGAVLPPGAVDPFAPDMELPARIRAVVDLVHDHGILPRLGNGFRVVEDNREGANMFDQIPPQPFTAYFARREAPIAPNGHTWHFHDLGHIIIFRRMFNSPAFAGLTVAAAMRAMNDPDLASRFTGAFDKLGDELFAVEELYMTTRDTILDSAGYIADLIDLSHHGDEPESIDPAADEALFAACWQELGLQECTEFIVPRLVGSISLAEIRRAS